ncbi:dynein assembly factor 5, axonemal [Anoplophora glabripennis]|uniref:dynein assembly factor 5, axonemal n=1 Tax=Anoplophora glabripennis TaxID=217634 RepID=UPI0008735776|nr:dynein assembly factor 5, axonemal [Anoplophora glabripennis]
MPCDTDENELCDDYVAMSKKICLKIQSQDRRIRKNAYTDLKKFLSTKSLNNQELRSVFCETHMYILNGLRDKTEIVREEAIQFLNFFIIEALPLNDFYLTYLFPVLVERIGSVELIEESEEVRLQLLQLLNAIISKYSNTIKLKPFLNDCVIILAETVKDKYPAIKELSCVTIILLAKSLPNDFHMQAESLIKSVLSCFVHQRYKVRLESINAIGEIILHSSYKGLDEVIGPLAEKLFDQIPAVRQAVARIAARWLLEYRDRYSYFHKILPLLLTGLNDEVEETRIDSTVLWEKVGIQYQEENEKDLKNQLDYLSLEPKYYPKEVKRPNLGCRFLVKRNVSKLSGAVSRELTSWQEDVRVRCSQLLCILILHAEDGITQNLQDLLPAIYSAARDDDRRVKKYQLELLQCLKALAEKHENRSNTTTYNLFKIAVTLLSLRHPDTAEEIFLEVFDDIKITLDLQSTNILWKLYTQPLLKHININPKIWTTVTDNACIYLTILCHSKEAFGENLEYIQSILNELFDPEADAEMKLKTLYVLANIFEEKGVFLRNTVDLTPFFENMVKVVFVPSLVWHAGATAEALRTMAVLCLRNVLISNKKIGIFNKEDLLKEVMNELLPLLISILEDASYRSRQLALECVILLKHICCEKNIWAIEDLIKVYPEILKRFDDPTEKVRLCALKNISLFFDNPPEEFKKNCYKAHHELIIDTLLTHFDDEEEDIQEMVCVSFQQARELVQIWTKIVQNEIRVPTDSGSTYSFPTMIELVPN